MKLSAIVDMMIFWSVRGNRPGAIGVDLQDQRAVGQRVVPS